MVEYIWFCHMYVLNLNNWNNLASVWSTRDLYRKLGSLIVIRSVTKFTTCLFNGTMEEVQIDDAYRYPDIVVIVIGIFGNILVILSLLRKKNVLKINHYFLVLQLAFCDLVVLIFYLYDSFEFYWLEGPLYDSSSNTLLCFRYQRRFSNCGCRYDVDHFSASLSCCYSSLQTWNPFKFIPLCIIKSTVARVAYWNFYYASMIFSVHFVPTMFMIAVYCKIGRAFI